MGDELGHVARQDGDVSVLMLAAEPGGSFDRPAPNDPPGPVKTG
jgi:hypothetical protein